MSGRYRKDMSKPSAVRTSAGSLDAAKMTCTLQHFLTSFHTTAGCKSVQCDVDLVVNPFNTTKFNLLTIHLCKRIHMQLIICSYFVITTGTRYHTTTYICESAVTQIRQS